MSAPNWPGTTAAFPYRSSYAVRHIQFPVATGNGEVDAPRIVWGSGSPEGVVGGNIGDLYIQVNAVTGVILFQKTTGTTPFGQAFTVLTGWQPLLANGATGATLSSLTLANGPLIVGGDPGGTQIFRVGGQALVSSSLTVNGGIISSGPVLPVGSQAIGSASNPWVNGIFGSFFDSGVGYDLILNRAGVTYLTGSGSLLTSAFPVIAPRFHSSAVSPAAAGVVRLGNNELIAWRNSANSGDITLTAEPILASVRLANASLTLGTGNAYQINAIQVVGSRITGYTAMTGTPDKATAYATSTVTLAQLAGRVAQLQADLTTHGLIGS